MPRKSAKKTSVPTDAATPARERILAGAERIFGERGFDGASMRRLAEAADVPVALVSYHFGSKEGVYRAVFERRAPVVVEQRLAGLAIAMSEPDLDRRLELVVKALVFPMLSLRAHDRDPNFGRLLANETTDSNSERRGVIREMFDPIARAVSDALASALPDRTEAEVWWAYQFMLGAMVHVMRDVGRLERLSGGLCRADDEAGAVRHMVAFLTAGVRYGRVADDPQINNKTTGEKIHAAGDLPNKRRSAARGRAG
jgi:AcrR family transcriptional regulator